MTTTATRPRRGQRLPTVGAPRAAARGGPGGLRPSPATTPPRWTRSPTGPACRKPVLYQHFPGKLDLYLALLDQHTGELLERGPRRPWPRTHDNKQRVDRDASPPTSSSSIATGAPFRLVFESDLTNEPAVARARRRASHDLRRGDRRGHRRGHRPADAERPRCSAWPWPAWPRSPRATGCLARPGLRSRGTRRPGSSRPAGLARHRRLPQGRARAEHGRRPRCDCAGKVCPGSGSASRPPAAHQRRSSPDERPSPWRSRSASRTSPARSCSSPARPPRRSSAGRRGAGRRAARSRLIDEQGPHESSSPSAVLGYVEIGAETEAPGGLRHRLSRTGLHPAGTPASGNRLDAASRWRRREIRVSRSSVPTICRLARSRIHRGRTAMRRRSCAAGGRLHDRNIIGAIIIGAIIGALARLVLPGKQNISCSSPSSSASSAPSSATFICRLARCRRHQGPRLDRADHQRRRRRRADRHLTAASPATKQVR